MSDPHRSNAPREFIPRSQPLHKFGLNIPPPPIPPMFSIPNTPPIPPPPAPPAIFSQPFLNYSSPFTTYTFQNTASSPTPDWSIPDQQLSYKEGSSQDVRSKSDSQDIVNGWLRHNRISRRFTKKPANTNIEIHKVKEDFNAAFKLIKELENGARTLSVMVKTVTNFEWMKKCDEIETKKTELIHMLNKLNLSEEDINLFKEKCSKRAKKRARLKRQAERRKKQKEDEKVRIQNAQYQIDNWQREMQEEVERVQREEDLQRQADAVLWGVTQKKTEARRQVALLSALLQLRQVRVQRLTAAGESVSQLQIQTFNTVIERLKKMWTNHLDEYLLEEQALRGMLGEAVSKEDPVKTYKKLVQQEWEMVLFGSVGQLDSNIKSDQLIHLRRSWDQFATKEHSVLSSTVPPGCVLPVPPSSEQWHTLLKY